MARDETSGLVINVPELRLRSFNIIIGGESLIQNGYFGQMTMSPDDLKKMSPQEEAEAKTHKVKSKDGNIVHAMPVSFIKKAASDTLLQDSKTKLKKNILRSTFNVSGTHGALSELHFREKVLLSETAWVQSGKKKVPFPINRYMFTDWKAEVRITYNADSISADQIVGMINSAGFSYGAGARRPENNGNCGEFRVLSIGKEVVEHIRKGSLEK